MKGKNLWLVLGVGAVAYYFWWMNKKKKTAPPATSVGPSTASVNFTGDLNVPEYQNAAGVPKFGKSAMYPSSQSSLGNRLSGF